ncbi:hypothetical protein HMPREF9444_00180 [Succinatimonas hippei YIT 12066]|uniref:Uncharacterized protein n=1 Tax=Succinatimonas hippei (strain DSM 22608 / JCM 16073 / KCTC 15190 / YIT 12066) TaxID=762983 RepID=E8LHK7_SUCHY|nr:hypothetical protein HMPREF9444_00180 [Succinatimonas hippei YIT 12066]
MTAFQYILVNNVNIPACQISRQNAALNPIQQTKISCVSFFYSNLT